MTHTLVASATREHIIGFDRPFTSSASASIRPAARSSPPRWWPAISKRVKRDALAQVEAGAHILDVNAGVTAVNPNETEPPLLGRRSRSCSR